jgi:hypothetical protein
VTIGHHGASPPRPVTRPTAAARAPGLDLRDRDVSARLQQEFRAGQAGDGYGFDAYMAQEQLLFDEVARLSAAQFDPLQDTRASRYAPQDSPYARRVDRDWNRSYVLQAAPAKGVALLIHSVSDSPYSLRSIALALQPDGVPGCSRCRTSRCRSRPTTSSAALQPVLRLHDRAYRGRRRAGRRAPLSQVAGPCAAAAPGARPSLT